MFTIRKKPPLTPYAVGDLIVYETFEGAKRLVCVTERTKNIRYGHPGFHALAVDDGTPHWGYDVQVEYVQTSAAQKQAQENADGLNLAHSQRKHEMAARWQAHVFADNGCAGCAERIEKSRW